jgi:hypothetical protein
MAFNRRNFIVGAGGALALVGVAGAWRVTRMPETASAPWNFDPRPLPDVRLDAFRHAILAPNPHNRQPWLIRLEGSDAAFISCDLDRRLPQTDPFDRQITIGFGTFLELARIAAAERGVRMEIAPFPAGEPAPRLDARPIARLSFVKDPAIARDPLFAAIASRRTNRLVYSAAPSAAELARIGSEGVSTSLDPNLLAELRELTMAAIEGEIRDIPAYRESIDLMRIGYAEIDANPDGLSLSGPMIEATAMLGLTSREALADPASTSFRIGLDQMKEVYGSIPAALWIVTPGNTRLDQLEAGRRYVRANLAATVMGLAMHPLSQSLQEYPAMAPHFRKVHELLGASGDQRVQMLARLGKADMVPAAPRWPLETHVLS